MNKIGLALMAATLMMASCKQETKQEAPASFIGKQEITVKDGRMTPEAL